MQDFTVYEYQVCNYHQDTSGHPTWHWSNAPVNHLITSGWVLNSNTLRQLMLEGKTPQEYGLDGIALKPDGSYTGIQAKMRKRLAPTALGTFYSACMRLRLKHPNSDGHLYYSGGITTHLRDELNAGMHAHFKHTFTKLIFDESSYKPIIYPIDDCVRDESKFALNQHQIDAVAALDRAYNDGWEGLRLLHMPCGTGKTIVFSTHVSKWYKHIVIISPLRIHAQQNLERMKKFLSNHTAILVDGDYSGTRDATEIKNALQKGACFISATYHSSDVLLECFTDDVAKMNDTIIIVDEAHRLSMEQNAVTLVNLFKRGLLVSATPPTAIDGYDEIPVVYSMNIRDAIQNNYIVDYKVILPTVESMDENELVQLKDLDAYYRPRVQFMMSGLMRFGSRRCIAYLPSVEACDKFLETCAKISEKYHGMRFWGERITNDVSPTKRREILSEFQSGDDTKIRVLASVL